MREMVVELDYYLRRLFPLCRSITGEPNRETLRILQEIVPLVIHEVPTGTVVYDWVIPDEWSIDNAWIADADGYRLVDFQENNLHIMSYSEPVDAVMDWDELKPHIHTHPELPDAIPYRTSYYERDWGFCVTHSQYELLEKHKKLTVLIESELKPGSLSYGEFLIPGRSSREILISCYICHPSMANDSLSGVVLTAFLARHIANIRDRQWSYRVVFVPETIGAITYCSRNEIAMKAIDIGLVITTVGGPGPFGYKQSFDGKHPINRLIQEVFADSEEEFITYPFDIHGSDERQYSSLGFRINVATISRDRYYEYAFYHSSLDNLNFVTAEQIFETLMLYLRLVEKLELRRIYQNTIPFGEVMLSRHDLYSTIGGLYRPEPSGHTNLDLVLWLLFLCDGRVSLDDIALHLGVEPERIASLSEDMVSKGILERL